MGRRVLVVLVLAAVLGSVAAAKPPTTVKRRPRTTTTTRPAGTTPTTVAPAGAVAAGCPTPGPATVAEGPSATVGSAQTATAERVGVALVRYPRPATPGEPWSQWGQGVVLADGRFLSAMGNHLGADGDAFLFVFDPATGRTTRFASVREAAGSALGWGYGKVHGQMVVGPCGEVYLATYWGSRTGLTYSDRYRGDLLLRVDPSTLAVESLGTLVPEHGVPSLAAGPTPGTLVGEAVDPVASGSGRDVGAFFVYDVASRSVTVRDDNPAHAGFRNVLVDGAGAAYVAAADGTLLRYRTGESGLRATGLRLPGGGLLRASTRPTADGTVYGVTDTPYRLFALAPDGRATDLGAAAGYTTSIAAEPDGSRLYYVPGAHGDGPTQGTPLVAVDPRTGAQTVLARLDDLTRASLGLRAGGSYDVVLDAANRRLYVGLNVGTDPAEPWGEVVLAVVELGPAGAPVAGTPLAANPTSPIVAATTATTRPSTSGPVTKGTTGTTGTSSARAGACRAVRKSGRAGFVATVGGEPGPVDWRDATDAWGLEQALTGMRGHAIATGDVNGDGWTDLFVGTFADRPVAEYQVRGAAGPAPDRLLLGGPDGFRVDRSFPEQRGRTSGAAFADLDGDGDPDLVVARQVRDADRGREPTTVFRNDQGRFTAVTRLAEPAGARSVGVLDADGDSRLDLIITEDRFAGGSSVLLRNRGGFDFVDVTRTSGIGPDVAGMGVGTGDLDGDGRPDLVIGGSNRVFRNVGGGRFAEVVGAIAPWTTYGTEDDAAGVTEADLDGDGRLDVVIGQHFNSTLDQGRKVPVRLYLNRSDEAGVRLRDVTVEAGLTGLSTKSPHVDVVDVDSDGLVDLVTTAADARDEPIVFRGAGERDDGIPRFTVDPEAGTARYWVTGAAFDADHDGRVDLVRVEWEPTRSTRAWRNVGDTGHWLEVVAPPGTAVWVAPAGTGGANGRSRSGVVGASTGYGAGPADRVRVGLWSNTRVDLRVVRPDGTVQRLSGVAVDRVVACGA